MTNDELLLKSLKSFTEQIKEELADEKGTDEISRTLIEEYEETLELLDAIVPKITGLDSLYEELDEDEFGFIIDCLENYQEAFIIDGRNPETLKRDEEEFSQLSDLMFDFYDDDDELDDDEYDDEDDEDGDLDE